jgi:biotin carboxyl carrier protein
VSDEVVGQGPANGGKGPPEGLEALTDEVLPALIARLRASRLGELEVRSGGWRVRLRRDPAAVSGGSRASAPLGDNDAPGAIGSVVRSPAVGYFSPAPELVIGVSVQGGDLLGVIDVLGITQEVTAPAEGIVADVLAEEGQAVEYGQSLATIDPMELEIPADDGTEETA